MAQRRDCTLGVRAGRTGARSSWRWVLAVLLMLLLPAGMQAQFSGPAPGPGTPINPPLAVTTDMAILYPGAREVHLAVGDLIGVHLFGATDYLPSTRVALDGTIQLPLIGLVQVAGLGLHDAEALIAQKLMDAGMYRDPQVTISLTESPNQIVTVTGEVHMVVPIYGEKRLLDVLAAAGGLPVTASHRITIDRPGVPEPIVVDLGPDPMKSKMANVPVFARDTVIVSRIGVVYVLGAFQKQGAIPLQPNTPLTLMQVAALGGGPGFEAKYNDLRIVRSNGLGRTVVQVDIKKVMNGKEPDPVLQADDIVFLPSNTLKAAIKVGGIGVLLGVVSTLLYIARP
jgi:polysaccharide export outer membrane protein